MKLIINGKRTWKHGQEQDDLTLEHDLDENLDDLVAIRIGEFAETHVPRAELIRVLRMLEETP